MKEEGKRAYGCTDYREEMRLMGLKRVLEKSDLTDAEREKIAAEIRELEARMGMD